MSLLMSLPMSLQEGGSPDDYVLAHLAATFVHLGSNKPEEDEDGDVEINSIQFKQLKPPQGAQHWVHCRLMRRVRGVLSVMVACCMGRAHDAESSMFRLLLVLTPECSLIC